jgi:hypothetical protein
MIAFKTFEVCPLELKPAENIPLKWPWQVSIIKEIDVKEYLNMGFNIMNEIDYENYLKSYQNEFDLWCQSFNIETQG